MAKKEIRRAARQSATQEKQINPKWRRLRRALIQGVLLAGVYLLLVRLVLRSEARPFWVDLFWTFIFFFFYTAFIYYWEQFLGRRRAKKRQQAKGSK